MTYQNRRRSYQRERGRQVVNGPNINARHVENVTTNYYQGPDPLAEFQAADGETKGETIPAKFSVGQVEAIDRVAREYQLDRSKVLRHAVEFFFAFHDNPYGVLSRLENLRAKTGQRPLEITMSALSIWEAVQFSGANSAPGR